MKPDGIEFGAIYTYGQTCYRFTKEGNGLIRREEFRLPAKYDSIIRNIKEEDLSHLKKMTQEDINNLPKKIQDKLNSFLRGD